MKSIFGGLHVRWKTMQDHCALKSKWQGNDTVTFLGQLSSIKADFQDAKRLPSSGKVNSLQIIVPFTQCVHLLGYFKMCLLLYRHWKTSLTNKARRQWKDIRGQRSGMWSGFQECQSDFILANISNFSFKLEQQRWGKEQKGASWTKFPGSLLDKPFVPSKCWH